VIQSMTGFGMGRAQWGSEELSVELRAVNHKFAEVKARVPFELSMLESELTAQIKATIKRGFLEVTVKRGRGGRATPALRVDAELARRYVEALDEVARALSLERNLGVAELAQVEGVVTLETPALDLEAVQEGLRSAAAQALEGLVAMRKKEGEALAADFRDRLSTLRAGAARVRELSPKTGEGFRSRLAERIEELSSGLAVDPQRLAQEVAVFADRIDVSEELTRLASHFEQFEALLDTEGPVGRKMDFLVQEMFRESNTTGSQSQSAEIAQQVVNMKAELERVREQVQNVE